MTGPSHHYYEGKWMGMAMSALMGFGALGIGIAVDSVVQIIEYGVTVDMVARLSASACLMIGVLTAAFLGYRWVGRRVAESNAADTTMVGSKLELN